MGDTLFAMGGEGSGNVFIIYKPNMSDNLIAITQQHIQARFNFRWWWGGVYYNMYT